MLNYETMLKGLPGRGRITVLVGILRVRTTPEDQKENTISSKKAISLMSGRLLGNTEPVSAAKTNCKSNSKAQIKKQTKN